MNRVKKIISMMLVLVLAMSSLAISASAAISEAYWYDFQGIEQGRGTLETAFQSVPTDGAIQVNKNVKITKTLEVTKTFRLVGKEGTETLTRGKVGDNQFLGEMFLVKSGKFTIRRLVLDGERNIVTGDTASLIKITGGVLVLDYSTTLQNNVNAGGNGGAVSIVSLSNGRDKARVQIENGAKIENCEAFYGGAVAVTKGGGLTINGGEMTDNRASYDGGAIYMSDSGSVLNMLGGELSGNTINPDPYANGSAICVTKDTKATITSGKIIGNTSPVVYDTDDTTVLHRTGAVFVAAGSDVSLGGNVYIFKNYDTELKNANVFLETTKVDNTYIAQAVGISDTFTDGAKVGVSFTAQYGDDSVVGYISTNGNDINTFMFDDKSGYAYFMDNKNVVHRCPTVVVTYNTDGHTMDVSSEVFQAGKKFGVLPVPDGVSGSKFSKWVDKNDTEITKNTLVPENTYEMTLTAIYTDAGSFSIIGRFFQRIAELMQIAFNFLKNLFYGNGDRDI